MTREEIEKRARASGIFMKGEIDIAVDFAVQIHDEALEQVARRCEGRIFEYMASEFRALKIGGAK